MNVDPFLTRRLVCVATIDRLEDSVPLANALLAGGMNSLEVTFRTPVAPAAITAIREKVPHIFVGAGTLLSAVQVKEAVAAGAHYGVSPGLSEAVSRAAREHDFPFIPGAVTPTEILRALDLGWTRLKFFPASIFGGAPALKALAGPFAHTGLKFIPTGGITPQNLAELLALPQVAAVGGTWIADRARMKEKAWDKITALASAAMKTASQTPL